MRAKVENPNDDLDEAVKFFSLDLVEQMPRRSLLGRDIAVDKTWAETLGIPRAKGARRVGHFYRIPRAEYLRLVKIQADPETSPCFSWTGIDDEAAVAVPA